MKFSTFYQCALSSQAPLPEQGERPSESQWPSTPARPGAGAWAVTVMENSHFRNPSGGDTPFANPCLPPYTCCTETLPSAISFKWFKSKQEEDIPNTHGLMKYPSFSLGSSGTYGSPPHNTLAPCQKGKQDAYFLLHVRPPPAVLDKRTQSLHHKDRAGPWPRPREL